MVLFCIIIKIEKVSFCKKYFLLTLLLRQTTGHIDIPSVQQQQMHPQSNQRTLTGMVLLSTLLTLVTVALYSSGATCIQEKNWICERRPQPFNSQDLKVSSPN